MKKAIILLTLLTLSLFTFSCGGGAGSSSSPEGINPGIPSVVKLLPIQSVAQTNSSIYLHTKVLDGNGIPVPNTPVTFINMSPIGVLSSMGANTDASGIATVTLSSTTPGFSRIQAEVDTGAGQVRDQEIVYFSTFELTWPQPTITLSIDGEDDDDSNGNPFGIGETYDEPEDFNFFETAADDTATVRAIARDEFGNKIVGMNVTFSGDTGASFPLGDTFTTNSDGEAFAQVRIDPTSVVGFETALNIQAVGENGAVGVITVFLEPVSLTGITLTANPTTIASGGTSTIIATITISAGTIPDDIPVYFSVSPVTIGSVSPVMALTSGGVATTTFTASATATGTATITARIGALTGPVNVTVVSTLQVTGPGVLDTSPPPATSGTFTISGGTSPYTVTVTNPTTPVGNTAVVNRTGANTFTITVVSSVTANETITITVTDALGNTRTVPLLLIP